MQYLCLENFLFASKTVRTCELLMYLSISNIINKKSYSVQFLQISFFFVILMVNYGYLTYFQSGQISLVLIMNTEFILWKYSFVFKLSFLWLFSLIHFHNSTWKWIVFKKSLQCVARQGKQNLRPSSRHKWISRPGHTTLNGHF